MKRVAVAALSACLMVPLAEASAHAAGDDRTVSLERPSRGGYGSVVRQAGTVPVYLRAWAECVLRRESGGVLHNKQSREDARNTEASSAAGRWQFLQAWQHGGSFMVRDRLVRFGMPKQEARQVRKYLGARPIYQWDGWWQDILFIEVTTRGGWRHWSGAYCNGLAPR